MKRIYSLAFSALLSISAIAQFKTPAYVSNNKKFILNKNLTEADYLPKSIIFKVKAENRGICSNNNIQNSQLMTILSSIGAQNLRKKFPFHEAPSQQINATGQKLTDLSLIYEFNYAANLSVEVVANKLLKTGLFEFAEPHYLPKISYQPNDPQATTTGQYHLNKIKAYTAWDISKGDTNVVIGITDTGSELTHADLSGNCKKNYNDPIDGIDNDGDNYIDNFRGWDVGMNDNDPTWQGDPHGVHVTGLAAASTDNAIGVAGVGFKCKFLPVKIADASGTLIAAYEGIVYAADHGCSIINCSWGGGGGGAYGQSVIDYATINKNALVVCASGNDNSSSDHYPSAYNYALSVASTTSNDNKSSFSNYGYSIDLCAPGSNVNSTYSNGTYQNNSGTSMASPIAAGAAAIVKSMFPSYSGLQVGEQLKATCDAINASVSGTYSGKLGKGRINLFQAISNIAAKSVTIVSKSVTDSNDNVFVGNDTLKISTDFVNFLAPLTNLTLTLSSTSTYVNILNPTLNVGSMATLDMQSNSLNPFMAIINPLAPPNSVVTFKVNFTDGTYTFNYYFNVVVNVDYINVTINDISTTITSKGRIGFNTDGQADGLGFTYKNSRQLLYEAGLMVGNSTAAVSDMVRGATSGSVDEDFASSSAVTQVIPSVESDFDLHGAFSDNIAPIPLGLNIKHKAFAWNTPGNTKYVIVEYTLFNNSNSALNTLYAGIFADWDIDDSSYASNRAEFDPLTKMGYAYYTGNNGTYTGIELLSNSAPVLHYAFDNVAGGAGGIDITNGFSENAKYTALRSNKAVAGASGAGTDVCDLVSTGPFSLAQGDSVVVAFALLAGDSLSDLQISAINAQNKYDSLQPLFVKNMPVKNNETLNIFPNPAKDILQIEMKLNQSETVAFEILNSIGQVVRAYENEMQSAGNMRKTLNIQELNPGLYFLNLKKNSGLETCKFTIR